MPDAEDAARLAEIQERISIMDLIPAEDGAWLLAELAKRDEALDEAKDEWSRSVRGEMEWREAWAERGNELGALRAELAKARREIAGFSAINDRWLIAYEALDAEVSVLRTALEGLPEKIAQKIEAEVYVPVRLGGALGSLTEYGEGANMATRSAAEIARSLASRPTPAPEAPRWALHATCCTTDDGWSVYATWDEADEARCAWVASAWGGHTRSGVVRATTPDANLGHWPKYTEPAESGAGE